MTAHSSLLFASLVVPACSVVDPRVGAPQEACGLSVDAGQGAHGAGYSRPNANQAPPLQTCGANTGSACDDCESQHCCATRSECYGDPVCACADLALDQCLEDAAAAPGVSLCWDAFSAQGSVEQQRRACQRAWCQTACAVP